MLMGLLERGIGVHRLREGPTRGAIVAAIERFEPFAVGKEGGEVLRALAQDALPLRLRQLNPELRCETEDELLLEIEQLLECAVRLGARPNAPVAAHHRRRHADRAVLRDRRDALDHPFRAQQTPDACGGAGIRPAALAQPQLRLPRTDTKALQEAQT